MKKQAYMMTVLDTEGIPLIERTFEAPDTDIALAVAKSVVTKLKTKFPTAAQVTIGQEMHVRAENVQTGDLCILSKEKVIHPPYRVAMTPKGRVELELVKGDKRRTACWNEYTQIRVVREKTLEL